MTAEPGETSESTSADLDFDGNIELLKLINDLCEKRKRRAAESRPILCLVRSSTRSGLLGALSVRLRSASPAPIPYTLKDLESDVDGRPSAPERRGESGERESSLPVTSMRTVEQVRAVLERVASGLGRSPGRGTSIRQFRRFALLVRLMQLRLPDEGNVVVDERTVRKQLAQRTNRKEPEQQPEIIPNDLGGPGWVRPIAVILLRMWLWLWFSGRVPLMGRPYRWFLRQQYVPRDSTNFVKFATRLTNGQWQHEDPAQVLKLLVHSFIADVRDHYEASWWHPRKLRMSSRCVVLLDNISRNNGGYAMVRAVNDVRNETGRPDPLVLITGSRKVPPYAESSSVEVSAAQAAKQAFTAWRADVREAKRGLTPIAWFLPLTIPAEQATGSESGRVLNWTLRAPVAPWHTARGVPLGLVIVLLAALAGAYATWSHVHCGGLVGFAPSRSLMDDECVGISDGSDPIFTPTDSNIATVVRTIRQQNDQAELRHEQNDRRPYVTLMFAGALNSATEDASGLNAERSGLEGVAVAQRTQLDLSADVEPLFRVLIANAGRGMRYGTAIAHQIAELAADDPSVVAVVGLSESRRPTKLMIQALGDAGLPVIAGTLSEDSLAVRYPTFYQMAPQNGRAADVVAAKVADLIDNRQPGPNGRVPSRSVRIYSSADPTDTYSANLAADLRKSFSGRGFQVEQQTFAANNAPVGPGNHLPDARAAGDDACGFDGVSLYAGRPIPDFGSFLQRASQCPTKPFVLANDDAGRFVANPRLRTLTTELPYWYVSFASPIRPTASTANFYTQLGRLFPFEANNEESRSLDGHAALSHYAALTVITAVGKLRSEYGRVPITPAAVLWRIADIHDSGQRGGYRSLVGAGGLVDFGGDVRNHVPIDKPVSILEVRDGAVSSRRAYCGGTTRVDPGTESWCPVRGTPRG